MCLRTQPQESYPSSWNSNHMIINSTPWVWINVCTQGTTIYAMRKLFLFGGKLPFMWHPVLIWTEKKHPYHNYLCEIWSLLLISPQLCSTQNRRAFPSSSVSLWLFAGELRLIVSDVAIQLWSRAVLQGCHDRINENNIGESHFIHVLLGKGPKTLF